MRIFQYLIALSCSLLLSSSIYASVTELNAFEIDKCRKQIKDSFFVNFAAVLVYSKDTDPKTLKLFETVSEERPKTPFFKFNLDDDSIRGHSVSRLCLGQLYNLHSHTLMLVTAGSIAFQSMGFGDHEGILSNKTKIEAVIDDSNDTMSNMKK